jgi:signal transduction histidine kinase
MPIPRPRNTVRLRLTLLYGGLFILSGACLLTITYLLVRAAGGVVVAITHYETGGPAGSGSIPPPPPLSSASGYASAQHAAELRQLLGYSAIALAIMAIASVVLGWLVAGRVLHPLRTITTSVKQISASNLNERLTADGPDDELSELAATFNALLDRLEAAFDAQRQFVANASHELRTPLARERTVMEVALRDPKATVGSLRAAGERVLASGMQQERLIEALLTLARSQRGLGYREPFDLRNVAAAELGNRLPDGETASPRLSSRLRAAPTTGDQRLAERLVANLVDNAIRHNVPGGEVEIVTETVAGRALISVANTGPEIAATEIARLKQPFQRRDSRRGSPRDGLGLGLSIVAAIAVAHDAAFELRPRPGGGLVAEVRFPGNHQGPPRRRSPSAPPAQHQPAEVPPPNADSSTSS